MLRVFVSSTSQDLEVHRTAVRDAVLALGMHPVMMEHFPAMDADALAACRQKVLDCDLFIGIYAHRYGYIPQGQTQSITELEYDWAGEAKIPRHVFVIKPDMPWRDEFRENTTALEAFKQRIGKERVWAEFTTPESLAAKVTQSLTHDLERLSRERRQQRNLLAGGIVTLALLLIGILAAILLSAPDEEERANREATNQAIAAINQTATATHWTPTPTATHTPTATATPLEGIPAAEGEILIVVAQFEQTGGSEFEPDIDMREVLEQAADEVGGVTVVSVGHPIRDRAEAQRISDLYRATMVIYGRSAPGGVTANYEITPRDGFINIEAEGTFRVSADSLNNFEAYLYEGMDVNYILGLTTGQLYYFDDSFDAAIRAFSLADDALDPGRAEDLKAYVLYYFRGTSYALQNDYARAIDDYTRAIELNPQVAEIYNNRGLAYSEEGDTKAAIADYDAALELDPNYANVYYHRGVAYHDLGNLKQAEADYTEAIRLDPQNADAYNDRGIIYADQGKDEQALADYSKAISLNPQNATDIYTNRAVIYADQGDFEAAIADCDQAIELDPTYADAYGVRGAIYYFTGDAEQAIIDLREYERLAGKDANPEILALLDELEAEAESR